MTTSKSTNLNPMVHVYCDKAVVAVFRSEPQVSLFLARMVKQYGMDEARFTSMPIANSQFNNEWVDSAFK